MPASSKMRLMVLRPISCPRLNNAPRIRVAPASAGNLGGDTGRVTIWQVAALMEKPPLIDVGRLSGRVAG